MKETATSHFMGMEKIGNIKNKLKPVGFRLTGQPFIRWTGAGVNTMGLKMVFSKGKNFTGTSKQ